MKPVFLRVWWILDVYSLICLAFDLILLLFLWFLMIIHILPLNEQARSIESGGGGRLIQKILTVIIKFFICKFKQISCCEKKCLPPPPMLRACIATGINFYLIQISNRNSDWICVLLTFKVFFLIFASNTHIQSNNFVV